MAPRKRSHTLLEDEDAEEEVLEVREARSSLRYSDSRKRAKGLNGAHTAKHIVRRDQTPSTESDDDEDQDAEDDGHESDAAPSPPRTQYEIERDAGYVHLQNELLDDQRATQKLMNRPTILGDNHVAENGIIESITCVNFMCHERLHCDLGPLINFIVGENGSGKSAVLTAITLCLGGKASSTNRGGNLKSFIKEGCDNSVLIVKIKNQGVDAFRSDLYGDSITIERHFSKAGGSGFKIKSATGRIISTKKADVDEITEYWSLQVDNPLNVLSQDNAREFLNSSKPSIKYKYFVKGVQLEQLDIDYKLLAQTAENHEIQLRALVERTEHARKKYEEAKRRQESINQNQELKTKLLRFRNQLAWSQVAEQEAILQQHDADVAELDRAITEADEEVDIKHQALERLDEELRRVRQAEEDARLDGDAVEEHVSQANNEFQAAKKAAVDLHREEKDVHGRLKTARTEVKIYEGKIAAERELLGESSGPARKKLEDQLAETRRQEVELEQQHSQSVKSLPELVNKAKGVAREVADIARDEEAKRADITSGESRLRELQNRTGSKYDGFEQSMPALLRRIEQDRGFGEKPVGPIGAHIQLMQPAWSSVLESFFGNTLNGFLVSSKKDQERLSMLMQQTNVKFSPIIIGKRLSPNVNLREPDQEFNTIMRVLKFDNEWVRDQLIINQMIEKVVLIEERRKAEATIGSGDVSRNVSTCLCFHDTKRGEGIKLTRGAEGNMSASPIREFRHSPRMKSDTDTRIALQIETLSQLQAELREIGTEKRVRQQALKKCETDQKTEMVRSKQIEQQLLKVQAAIERIETDLDQFEGATGRLTTLETQLTKAKEEEKHWGDQYGSMNLEKPKLNRRSEECKRKLDEAKLLQKDYEAGVGKAQGLVKRTESLRQIGLVEKNDAHATKDTLMIKRQRAEEKREAQSEQVALFTRSAAEVSAHRVYIEEGETHQSIEQKYETHRRMLKKRQQQAGATEEEINDDAASATVAYNQAKSVLTTQKEEQQVTKGNLEYRKDMWRQFQRHISARTRVNFQYLLSERGFRGRLELDHPNKKLSCRIEPDETRKSSAGRSTKTLSGGEKSFSSICMLLAIWEAMGSPLRCLDEFDVFMDNVNRAMSTNMLITAARRSVSRQYILITPNAIEGRANLDKDVKIIRLTDPRQRTLV